MRRFGTPLATCWFVVLAGIALYSTPHAATPGTSGSRSGAWWGSRSAAPASRPGVVGRPLHRGASRAVRPFRTSGWTGCGVVLSPVGNTNVMSNQQMFPDGSGGAVVAWSDGRGGTLDPFASRIDGNGDLVSGWALGGNPLSPSDSSRLVVGAGPDATGGLFAVLTNVDPQFENSHDIYLQRLTGAGTVAPSYPAEGKLMRTGPIDGGGMLADGAGGLFFGWGLVAGNLFVTRLDASGNATAGWPAGGLDTGVLSQSTGEPALDGVGGFYLSWTTATTLNVQRYTNTGPVSGWPVGGLAISGSPAAGSVEPRVARLSSGDLIVAWGDPTTGHVFAQRVTAAGGVHASWPAGGVEIGTGTTPQNVRAVIADGAGGALILWEESSFFPPVFRVVVQRVTATGGISGTWPVDGVPVATAGMPQGASNLISDGLDGVLVAWTEIGTGNPDIYLQRILSNGATHVDFGVDGVQVCDDPGDQLMPGIASDGASGAILIWQDYTDINHPQLRGGRVTQNGVVDALASLVTANAEPGVVRLHWYTPDGSVARATVERAEGDGGFEPIGDVQADGAGHLRFEDRDVAPGATYRYRLAALDQGQRVYLGEVTVQVPAGVAFGITGFHPNPAPGEPSVAFALESGAPARLDVLDVAGRRLVTREVGGMGAGAHQLRLGVRLPAGLYVLRLSQSGRTAIARSAIVK